MPGMIRPDLQALAQHFQLAEKSGASRPAGLPSDTTGLLQTEGNSGTIATGGTVLRDLFSLFPAYAGVIPTALLTQAVWQPFPRIGGGDPIAGAIACNVVNFSPHTRG